MNEEEKAVFDVLENEQQVGAGEDDELGDDFVLMLNGGVPALELIEGDPSGPVNEAHDNQGVIVLDEVLKDTPDGEGLANHPGMLPNYKERMAGVIAMLDKQ